MLRQEPNLPVYLDMLADGLPAITFGAENHRIPEAVHDGQMAVPVFTDDGVEDGANQFIPADTVIECVDQRNQIVEVGDVVHGNKPKALAGQRKDAACLLPKGEQCVKTGGEAA
jgi:hypothetical protein